MREKKESYILPLLFPPTLTNGKLGRKEANGYTQSEPIVATQENGSVFRRCHFRHPCKLLRLLFPHGPKQVRCPALWPTFVLVVHLPRKSEVTTSSKGTR